MEMLVVIHQRKRDQSGLALIATLVLMVLLVTLMVGMYTQASIEVRSANPQRDQEIARANARLALAMAMGQLQSTMGPDVRVSATAAQLDEQPGTTQIEGVAHPHWTGVWASARREDDHLVTPWKRVNGSLTDQRFTGEGDWEEPIAWLVSSGSTSDRADPRRALPEQEAVELLSARENEGGREVRVAAMAVEGGRIAWWSADESQKAKLNIRNPWHDRSLNPATPDDGGYWQMLAAADIESELIGVGLQISEDSKMALISRKSVELLDNSSKAWSVAHVHDVTVHSLGLCVNVRDGRLKRDLSAWQESNGIIEDLQAEGEVLVEGLSDSDRMVGAPNERVMELRRLDVTDWKLRESAPRFGVLRHWSRMGLETLFTADRHDALFPATAATSPGSTQSAYDGTNAFPVSVTNVRKSEVAPVLVEASLYYHIAATRSGSVARPRYGLQVLLYPRVALWNPYNVALEVDPTMLMLHINGRKQIQVNYENGSQENVPLKFGWERSGGAHVGSLFFSLSKVTIPAGECLFLSPSDATPYNGVTLDSNLLTSKQPPSPDRWFSLNLSTSQQLSKPESFIEIGSGFQAEDYRVVWKQLNGASGVKFSDFDRLPQLGLVSCALQYGDNMEMPVQWVDTLPAPVVQPDTQGRLIALEPPDVRTRDGYRMRWFDEHFSNQLGSGSLAGTHHFEIAPLANWNPRAPFTLRSPWENVTDSSPTFFGLYTRDLFDGAVAWEAMQPVPKEFGFSGFPFGPPSESPGPLVLFDLPRSETGVISLGQLQHLPVSRFAWHPTYAIGNSLADPRLEEHTERTNPEPGKGLRNQYNGWNRDLIGYATDGRTGGSQGNDQWAYYGRWMILGLPESEPVVYDLSYELNHTLWDDFYFSSGDSQRKAKFVEDPHSNPLPNSRMRLLSPLNDSSSSEELSDFHRSAYHLAVDGAFNVNSTRVEAWKAVLGATRDLGGNEKAIFPRILNPPSGAWTSTDSPDDAAAWSGYRELDDSEIERLAEAVVGEVKRRGPFLSMSDFINRRLSRDESARMGVLEAAIEKAGINRAFEERWPLRQETLKDYRHRDNIADATRIDHALMPATRAWGAAGHLTQADMLQTLGPVMTVRSDTFVIRAYGESTGIGDQPNARAWCEAVVQRTAEPLNPDGSGINPRFPGSERDFGRRFEVVSFRWLSADEI